MEIGGEGLCLQVTTQEQHDLQDKQITIVVYCFMLTTTTFVSCTKDKDGLCNGVPGHKS